MAVALEVPCFLYCGKNLVAQLVVKQGGGGTDSWIKCPIRDKLHFLSPEERVRQALLWFFLYGANNADGWRECLRFEVEQRSIDFAVFLKTTSSEHRFIFNIPVLIVETKRQEQQLIGDTDIEEQLKTYMIRERCRSGFIFNACQAVWLSVCGEFTSGRWTRHRLSDLCEMEDRLREATEAAKITYIDYKNASTRAADGDFELAASSCIPYWFRP